jgi:hypothetical protein
VTEDGRLYMVENKLDQDLRLTGFLRNSKWVKRKKQIMTNGNVNKYSRHLRCRSLQIHIWLLQFTI